jgi:hypothetical protein
MQIKLASVKLAMKYTKRVSTELEVLAGGPDEEELMLQAVRFAFRVHQVYLPNYVIIIMLIKSYICKISPPISFLSCPCL